MMELLIPEETSPISFRSSCFATFFPTTEDKGETHQGHINFGFLLLTEPTTQTQWFKLKWFPMVFPQLCQRLFENNKSRYLKSCNYFREFKNAMGPMNLITSTNRVPSSFLG